MNRLEIINVMLETRFQKEQLELVQECKKGIETSKLALWSLKAELSTAESEFVELNEKIGKLEDKYYRSQCKSKASLFHATDSIKSFTLQDREQVLAIPYPTASCENIAQAICLLLGYSSGTWKDFKRLLKNFQFFHRRLTENAYSSSLNYVKVFKKISLVSKEYAPSELFQLNNWVLFTIEHVREEISSDNLKIDIEKLLKESSNCYLEIFEIKDSICNTEIKIKKLLSCIEKADINIKLLKNLQSEEDLDEIIQSCNKNYMFFKREVNSVEIPGVNEERMSVNPLVESFLWNFNISIDNEVSRSVDSLDDHTPLVQIQEKSLEAYDHLPDIQNQSARIKKQKSKRKCCGFA